MIKTTVVGSYPVPTWLRVFMAGWHFERRDIRVGGEGTWRWPNWRWLWQTRKPRA